MANICIPKEIVDKITGAMKSGEINPEELFKMSSKARTDLLKQYVGNDAPEINKLFEAHEDYRKLNTRVTHDEATKINELANKVKENRGLDMSDKESRIKYGRSIIDMNEYADSLKPKGSPFTFSNIMNLPKSALTSVLHFSAPFVQGWGMLGTKNFYNGIPQMFKYFGSEEAFKNLNADIISHPNYEYAKQGKLGLTQLGDKLSKREEGIHSSLLEHIPGIKRLAKASGRAFTGYLNYIRFNRFSDLIEAAKLQGEDLSKGSRNVRDIAKAVNDFTGRGAIGEGDKYGSSAPFLNTFFFSPRKLAATIEMFNPLNILDPKMSPTARMARIRQLSGSIIATFAVNNLLAATGGQTDWNPISANFGKVKFGKTTLDMTGGNSTYIRLLAQLITNQTVSASGKKTKLGEGYKPETRMSLAEKFLIGKLAPIAGAVAGFLGSTKNKGERIDSHGNKITPGNEAEDLFAPIVVQDFIHLVHNDPGNSAVWLPSLGAFFGVSMETQKKK